MEEVGADKVAPALQSLARASENHSEQTFHKLVERHGLALNVPFTDVKLDSTGSTVPMLLLSSWFDLILSPVIM